MTLKFICFSKLLAYAIKIYYDPLTKRAVVSTLDDVFSGAAFKLSDDEVTGMMRGNLT